MDDLQETFQSYYADQMASWQSWWDSNTKHGCFCGAGSVCDAAIDSLDTCCGQHDADYAAVGQSSDTMWSIDGLIATRHADRALATCAAGAETKADDEHSNPDPEGYRGHLIQLFTYRADVGDALAAMNDRLHQLHEALDGFSRFLHASAADVTQGDAEAVGTAQQHVAYLQSLEATADQIAGHLDAQGIDTAAVRQNVDLG